MRRREEPRDLADRDRRAAKMVIGSAGKYRDYPGLVAWAAAVLGVPNPLDSATASQRGTDAESGGLQTALDFGGER